MEEKDAQPSETSQTDSITEVNFTRNGLRLGSRGLCVLGGGKEAWVGRGGGLMGYESIVQDEFRNADDLVTQCLHYALYMLCMHNIIHVYIQMHLHAAFCTLHFSILHLFIIAPQ